MAELRGDPDQSAARVYTDLFGLRQDNEDRFAMQMIWLAKDGVQQGPMSVARAQTLIRAGQYQPHHMAWLVGALTWRTIAETYELSVEQCPPGEPLGADNPRSQTPPPVTPHSSDAAAWSKLSPHSQSPKPWRRYAARALDTALLTAALKALVGPRLPFGGLGSSFLLGLPTTLLLVLIETLCLQHYQTTVGKYFFGIIVRSQSGASLSQKQSLERAVRVAFFGNALGAVVLSSVANWVAYLDIRRPESATWDRATQSVVLYRSHTAIHQMLGGALLVWLAFSGFFGNLIRLLWL